MKAVERLAGGYRPELALVAFANRCEEAIGQPDVHHDVSKFAHIKIAALSAHQSQAQLITGIVEKYKEGDPEAVERINNERFWSYSVSGA